MFEAIGEGHRVMHEGQRQELDLDELERLAQKPIRTVDELIILAYAVPELIARVRELEAALAELVTENSRQKRVIHMLENRVLELKGKPIPMEPRLPTCDALVHPRHPLQSNRSNAKEAGNV